MTPAELGRYFEKIVALVFTGTVTPTPHYDVVADGKYIECKSRTRGSDGLSYRTALYPPYFTGRTDSIAFGYFDEMDALELTLLVPTTALKLHFDLAATFYNKSMRWRPTRRFIEAMPEALDITDLARRAAATAL
jgi:hypothetical protein